MTTQKSQELHRIIQRIDAVAQKSPGHREVLEFLKGIATEQYAIKQQIKQGPVNINAHQVKLKAREGFALIDKKELKIDINSAAILFKRLCTVVRKRNAKIDQDIRNIMTKLETAELDLVKLFEKLVAEDQDYLETAAEKLKLNKELILFLAKNSINPLLEVHAEQLKVHVDQKGWWRGYCPICGSKPIIAELRKKEGQRFVHCSACAYQWRFKRMKCPFCDTEDTKKHRYFYMGNEPRGYRVDVCEKCKKYIKTIDTRERSEAIVVCVEDIATLHLDILAHKEGYERVVANMLNV